MKIDEPGPYPFVEMGRSSTLALGQWVIAVGHPGGFRPNRSPVVRLGRVLMSNPFLIRTDCAQDGGDSGGPLFDLDGVVVGIHSRIGPGAITENVHVPIDTYKQTWDRLASAESWGERLGDQPTVESAGGKIVFERKDNLTPDDFIEKGRGGCHYKSYTVTLKSGATYTIDLTSRLKKGGFDAYLLLENAAGRKLAEDDDSGGFTDARIVHRALRDGEYRVVVTTCDPGQVGAFRLTVREADLKDHLVAGRVDVFKTLRLPRQMVPLIIEKLAEADIRLHLTAQLQDDKGQPVAAQQVVVRWDNGEQKLSSTKGGVVRLALKKDRLKNLTLELPDSVKAYLNLTDESGKVLGPRYRPDQHPWLESVKSAGGSIVADFQGLLTEADPLDTDKKGCHHKVHELRLSPGAAYTFDLHSEDFDAFLRLEDAAGKKLAEDDDGASYLNSRIVFRTNQEGAFRLVVTSCDPGQVGPYRLTVRRAEDPVK
jgi:hypothetical protein